MSKAVPHFSEKWLEEYRRRLGSNAERPSSHVVASAKPIPALVPHRPKSSMAVPVRPSEGKMTKTEEKYNREVLGGVGRFESVSLRLPGGGRYTPDFMTVDDGVVTFHEVKGSYRLGSQGRAYTAFHEAAAWYPMWRFVWAHWTGKEWDVKKFAGTGI